MSDSFLSQSWYRVAQLKPLLRRHAKVHRLRYRQRAWYALQDLASGKSHRFTPQSYLALSLMDGQRTVHDIWTQLGQELGQEAPSQDDMIKLLGQLHAADVLQTDVPPDLLELSDRGRKQRHSILVKNLTNPLSIRIPLWDPDRFLTATYPYLAWLFSWRGMLLWLALVAPALVLAVAHWSELTHNLSDQVLASSNLLWLWLVFPLVKLLHELGHGYLTKSGGGDVHEMGIMFLVLMPIPYVDASAASTFRNKWHRAAVGAAGMLVELFLAALALYVWLAVEPGLTRAIAFNVIFIAGVSTLVFNGNPLLRYDGYYILSDLIEIPNLGTQANRYLGFLAQRYAFGKHDVHTDVETRREKLWLVFYGVTSFFYRIWIMLVMALFIASQFFFVGVVMAIWGLVTTLLVPLVKGVAFVYSSPALHRQRQRALTVTGTLTAALLVFCLAVPMPLSADAQGVVWVPENAEIRADTPGFVRQLLVPPETVVKAGDLVLESRNPQLHAELQSQWARIEQFEVERISGLATDPLQASLALDALQKERAALANLESRVDGLAVRARTDGRLVLPRAADLPGKYLKRGELVGYVLTGPIRTVRTVVAQQDSDLVRGSLRRVNLKLADRLDQTYPGAVVREVPGGRDELPSRALAVDGGGLFATDPRDPSGLKTLERVFQLDVSLPDSVGTVALGTRAWVRFELKPEPLAFRWYRRVRLLLLSHFNV